MEQEQVMEQIDLMQPQGGVVNILVAVILMTEGDDMSIGTRLGMLGTLRRIESDITIWKQEVRFTLNLLSKQRCAQLAVRSVPNTFSPLVYNGYLVT